MEDSPAVRPLVLAVDDDPAVGRAIERDLRRRYGARHRVVLTASGEAALGVVEEIVRRGEPVALLVADQRMPGMTGVEFLSRALKLAPHAKRVLLTAYAETDAAIRAINELRLDHYLMKPWTPPEERLYPVLDDVLEDWEADRAVRAGTAPRRASLLRRGTRHARLPRSQRRSVSLARPGRRRGRSAARRREGRRHAAARARPRGRAGARAADPG